MSQTFEVQEPASPIKPSGPWQFSLKGLLIFMTVCSAIFAMMAFPALALFAGWFSLLALLIFCLTATIYGRGWIRPFAISCGATLLFTFYWMSGAPMMAFQNAFLYFFVQILICVMGGFCGAVSHGYLKRRSGIAPIPNIPFLRKWLFNPEELASEPSQEPSRFPAGS